MAQRQLIPLSRISPTKKIVAQEDKRLGDRERGMKVLMEAQNYWYKMDLFRRERERNKRYMFGDQWGDPIKTENGIITEAEYIRREGNTPLKNNLIRRLVRNVVGFYRNQNNEPVCTARDRKEQVYGQVMSTLLQYNMQRNQLSEMRAREMEEFLLSGLVVERKWWGWAQDTMDCWTRMVPVNNFIVDNNMLDVRGWDCNFVGEVHDIEYPQLCAQFARSDADYEKLHDMYAFASNRQIFSQRWNDFGYSDLRDIDFFVGNDYNRCRVIEVWRKEKIERYRCHDWLTGEIFKIEKKDRAVMVDAENRARLRQGREAGMPQDEIPLIDCEWFIDTVWYYYFLSPFGDILDEGETPFDHKSHPYSFKVYPFIDGEIHSFVADVIDQQRFINRLIIMMDMAIRSSAKGLMMIPRECVPDGMSEQEFAEMSTSYRGMIFYKSKGVTQLPTVITSNSMNVGMTELLNIQTKLMEDISGVHGALQGKTPVSGTSGTLYAQQTENATTSLVDIVMAFQSFELDAAKKDLKNIQQFYDPKMVENIAGDQLPIEMTPERVLDMEFDLSIHESQRTAVYREIQNNFLMQIWQSGQISLEQLLEAGNFEFADDLLQSLQAQKEKEEREQQQLAEQQAQAGQQAQGGQRPIPRTVQQQIMRQQGSPDQKPLGVV